jgi:hypothetical protein
MGGRNGSKEPVFSRRHLKRSRPTLAFIKQHRKTSGVAKACRGTHPKCDMTFGKRENDQHILTASAELPLLGRSVCSVTIYRLSYLPGAKS